jgi:lysophospholipase
MLALLVLSLLLSAAPVLSSYVPQSATCPTASLVRPANGLSDEEETYRVARKAIADQALAAWLTKTNSGFGTAELPTVRFHVTGNPQGGLILNRLH